MSAVSSPTTYQLIYATVRQVPKRRVATYGQIAELAVLPRQARQVGYALHALSEKTTVPWHRVVNAQVRVKDQADEVIAYTQKCIVVELDTRIALLAAELHRQHKLATADAIVYATAQDQGADLLTCDRHFIKLPGVIYLSKAA
jgi:alkylated DNA nucleotide flippase Atl1